MKSKIVPISNVARLSEAATALVERPAGMPGMGLIEGETGYGKTTAAAWLITRMNGVYVRALATSTPSSLLDAICKELNILRRPTNVGTVEAIVQRLAETQRPVFIDEADYLVDQKRLVETLRDIHDLATVPVILIGMAGIRRKLTKWPQFTGRISQWVDFTPSTFEDAKLLARELAEVPIADDLVRQLHTATHGSVRLIVVGLARIEQFARSRGLERIAALDWPAHGDFFIGSAPTPKTRPAISAVR
ncbi:AAA family ATPase [Tahibacter soli]|uniref:ATP-binding protein n=1 Tax=Tahibacter soli TaxID=2983605 RepID=A0A9X3YHB0_9GAMM|nr:ATP-binding protein [Tahibacter soli]MDC8012262.1 ATP-binding protein [Tahibacter soli]